MPLDSLIGKGKECDRTSSNRAERSALAAYQNTSFCAGTRDLTLRSNEPGPRESNLSAAKRIAYIAAGIAVTTFVSLGCSWDYPVWPKDKKSDIPLFRFVINEREGAGYIDRDGRIIIQPTLSHFGNNSRDDFFD